MIDRQRGLQVVVANFGEFQAQMSTHRIFIQVYKISKRSIFFKPDRHIRTFCPKNNPACAILPWLPELQLQQFRYFYPVDHTIVVKTLQGLEPVLAKELEELGVMQPELRKRAVAFRGDEAMVYVCNIWLRTALRVMVELTTFHATDDDDLYAHALAYDWRSIMDTEQTFALDATVYSPIFRHSGFAALRVKDAIADHFRKHSGKRPSVDLRNPDFRIQLHINVDQVTLYLDSSGESLHRRGYRSANHEAPISEVLAAGMLLLSGWDRKLPLYDPMCGSGTLVIEAGLLGYNIAPGLIRKEYGFKKWKHYNEKLFRRLLLDAATQATEDGPRLFASDRDAAAVRMAEMHAGNARLKDRIRFFVKPFENADPPEPPAIAICNPPYGKRLEQADANGFFREMGNVLKRKYAGYTVWLISANTEAMKYVGLRPAQKFRLKNGPLDCLFASYEITGGKYISRKNMQE